MIQKEVVDNSEELQFYLRDLKQWEAEIRASDAQLLRMAERGEEETPVPIVRNLKKSSQKTTENSTPGNSTNCERIEAYDSTDDAYYCTEEVEEQRLKQQAILEKEKGNNFLNAGEIDKAIECYSKGKHLDPFNALLPANRALALLKKEQFADAEEDCNLAISIDPNYVKAYLRRATARLAQVKLGQAKSDLLEALRLEPQNKEAKNQLQKVENILVEKKAKDIHVLPIHKEPHQNSKVQLRRIKVVDIGQPKTMRDPADPVAKDSDEIRNVHPAGKRATELPKPPQTSYEFQTELRRLKSYPELVYRYVKELPCTKYVQFFQDNLESECLSQMLVTFRDFYMWNNDDMYQPLFNLSQTKRFPTLKMFFSENDKRVLKDILDHMTETHAHPMEQLISLKHSYGI